ncbi:hypothetical protein ACJZ2D_014649 [Fusarium nematophilum]
MISFGFSVNQIAVNGLVTRLPGRLQLDFSRLQPLRAQRAHDALHLREVLPHHAKHAHTTISRPHSYIEDEKGEDVICREPAAVALEHHFGPRLQGHIPRRDETPRPGLRFDTSIHLTSHVREALLGLAWAPSTDGK